MMLMGAPSVDGFALNIQFQDCEAPGCGGISDGCCRVYVYDMYIYIYVYIYIYILVISNGLHPSLAMKTLLMHCRN